MLRCKAAVGAGPGDGRSEYADAAMRSVKPQFALMIGAKPEEIAFVQNTKAGEDIVLNGLDIQASGGNVVTNDLHYAGSIHSYVGRRKAGMDVRFVRSKNWVTDLAAMEAAMDKKTKLVAITLVSNVNGHIEDAKAITEMAHANGGYVYADIIQAAGAIHFLSLLVEHNTDVTFVPISDDENSFAFLNSERFAQSAVNSIRQFFQFNPYIR